jgi:hypothetical protein
MEKEDWLEAEKEQAKSYLIGQRKWTFQGDNIFVFLKGTYPIFLSSF